MHQTNEFNLVMKALNYYTEKMIQLKRINLDPGNDQIRVLIQKNAIENDQSQEKEDHGLAIKRKNTNRREEKRSNLIHQKEEDTVDPYPTKSSEKIITKRCVVMNRTTLKLRKDMITANALLRIKCKFLNPCSTETIRKRRCRLKRKLRSRSNPSLKTK